MDCECGYPLDEFGFCGLCDARQKESGETMTEFDYGWTIPANAVLNISEADRIGKIAQATWLKRAQECGFTHHEPPAFCFSNAMVDALLEAIKTVVAERDQST